MQQRLQNAGKAQQPAAKPKPQAQKPQAQQPGSGQALRQRLQNQGNAAAAPKPGAGQARGAGQVQKPANAQALRQRLQGQGGAAPAPQQGTQQTLQQRLQNVGKTQQPAAAPVATRNGQALTQQQLAKRRQDALQNLKGSIGNRGAGRRAAAVAAARNGAALAPNAPNNADVTVTQITRNDVRTSSQEFNSVVNNYNGTAPNNQLVQQPQKKKGLSDFEKFGLIALGAVTVGAVLNDRRDRAVLNTGDRVVVRRNDGGLTVLRDDDTLLRQPGTNVRTQSYDDGSTLSTLDRADGTQIVTIRDVEGRVLRRARINRDGSQTVLIDDTRDFEQVDVSRLPQEPYYREDSYGTRDQSQLRAALEQREPQGIDRTFSLQQVREIPQVRDLAPEVDLNAITFDSGSAAVAPDQAESLQQIGDVLANLVQQDASEVFLIEGHTDAVGSDVDNLALSDRRAESVAKVLTEYFQRAAREHGRAGLRRTLPAHRDQRRRAGKSPRGHPSDHLAVADRREPVGGSPGAAQDAAPRRRPKRRPEGNFRAAFSCALADTVAGRHSAVVADHDQIPEAALSWAEAGRGAALATVIETWGSAPRPAGSQLAISGDGEMAGSVSGGCVEGAVVAEALEAMADGAPRVLSYGVADETAFAVGLACGGTIRVLVEPVGPALPVGLLRDLAAARSARASAAYLVNLETWERRIADSTDALATERLRADRSGMEGDWLVAVQGAALRLVVVGAVHIAQSLVAMARLAGYDPVIVDPREAFGSAARFPGERILDGWPDEALAAHGLDSRTAVVTLTHDPKLDDPAIRAALGSEVFYLGCLGSKRTHAARLERLREAGFDDAALARIHAPIGLDIGAKSPAEIAVAILAEITQALRQGA